MFVNGTGVLKVSPDFMLCFQPEAFACCQCDRWSCKILAVGNRVRKASSALTGALISHTSRLWREKLRDHEALMRLRQEGGHKAGDLTSEAQNAVFDQI